MFKRLHQSWLLVSLCVGIFLGTVLAIIFRFEFFASPLWIIFVVLLFGFAFLKPNYFFVIIIFLAGIILAFFRTSADLSGEVFIEQFVGKTVEVSGQVTTDPNSDEGSTTLMLSEIAINEEMTKGTVFVSLSGNRLDIKRSDIITLSGRMSDGFGSFSGAIYRPEIKNIAHPEPGDIFLKIRDAFSGRVKEYVPEKESSLGLAYLLGMKAELSDEITDAMRIVGLTHIVVASGTHLGIIVEITKKLFGRVSRFAGFLFSILLILIFGGIIGWTASILRAAIVTIFSLLAWYVGRKFEAWRILLIAIALTLLINPMFITNLGWLLSFASFAGILIFEPMIQKFFFGEKKISKLAEIILATISAQLLCIPILLYFFGSISLISPIANVLILPTIPLAMGLTFLTGVLAFPMVGNLLGFLTKILLDYHLMIVNFFVEQKMFLVSFEPNNPLVFLLYVFILVPLIIKLIKDKKSRKFSSGFLLSI